MSSNADVEQPLWFGRIVSIVVSNAHGGIEPAGEPDSAAAFSTAVSDAVRRCIDLGYRPSYFLQMLGEHGAVETARRLIVAPSESEGFTRLWELGRLDLTVEALVLRTEYASLFDDSIRGLAESRLARYGYRP